MRIAIIAGDGIGREVTAEAVKVLKAVGDAFGRRLELEHLPWSADHFLKTGETLPANGYQLLREFDAISRFVEVAPLLVVQRRRLGAERQQLLELLFPNPWLYDDSRHLPLAGVRHDYS